MNINDITIAQARELCRLFGVGFPETPTHAPIPVVVSTDQRGVVFGYTTNVEARPIHLTQTRMCLYWSAKVGGMWGLGDVGPVADSRVSATAPAVTLEGVVSVLSVSPEAEKVWVNAPVQRK